MRQMEPRHQGCLLIQDSFLASDRSSVLPGSGFRSLCLCPSTFSFLPSSQISWLWACSQVGSLYIMTLNSSWHITSLKFLGVRLTGMIWIHTLPTVTRGWGAWPGHVCILWAQKWVTSQLNNVDWEWKGGRSWKENQIAVGKQKSPVSTWSLVNNQQLGRWMIRHSENLSMSCWTKLLGLSWALQRETVFPVFLIKNEHRV